MNGTEDVPQMSNGLEAGPQLPPRVHIYDYLIVLARYRRALILTVVGGGLLVAGFLLVAPQTFIAGATLLPPDKSESLNLAALASSAKFDFKSLSENSSAETLVRIIKSRTMGDSLIARYNLLKRYNLDSSKASIVNETVIGNFIVTSDRQGFIDVSYAETTGFLPSEQEQKDAAQFSAKMVNGAISILDMLNQQKSVAKARHSREFVGKMKDIKRMELDTAQRALLLFQQQNKAIALDKQFEASLTGLVDLQTQIQKKELELSTAQQDLNPDTKIVTILRSQLTQLHSQKSRLEQGQIGGDGLGLPMKGVPELMRQLANLKLNLEVVTQVYTYLEAQYNQEQIQEAKELPTVSVLDPAEAPIRRTSPRRTLILAAAIASLLLVGIVGVFIHDAYRRSWNSLDPSRRSRFRETLRRGRKSSSADIA
ncbi:MAG: GNVR domain-containing protein [Candidatus Kapaibacterium sp.]